MHKEQDMQLQTRKEEKEMRASQEIAEQNKEIRKMLDILRVRISCCSTVHGVVKEWLEEFGMQQVLLMYEYIKDMEEALEIERENG